MPGSLVIVIPCHNEEYTLSTTVRSLLRVADRCSYSRFEILLVDDGSSDDTWQKIVTLRDIQPDKRIRGIRLGTNLGKNVAVALGIREVAPGTQIVVMDADGQHNPESLLTLLARSDDSGLPCVGMRSNYVRRPSSALGFAALRVAASVMGIKLNPRETEFLTLPPAVADSVRMDQQLGVAPLLSVVHSKTEVAHAEVVIERRIGGTGIERWPVSDLWQKALLHLLSDPWRILPRIAAFALAATLATLLYGLWVGVQSMIQGTFLGVGSVIVFQSILFSLVVILSMLALGLLVTQFQSRVLSNGQSLIVDRCGYPEDRLDD